MSERKLEHCCECDYPTGRAGRSDDSLYFRDFGPFCEDCYDALRDKINEEISQLRAKLADQAKSYQRVIQEEYGKREALDAQLAEAQKVEKQEGMVSVSVSLPVITDELWGMFSETSLMSWDRENNKAVWTQDAVDFVCYIQSEAAQGEG